MASLKLFGEKGVFGKGRRGLVIALSVLIIGAAVYLNYLYFFSGNSPIGYTDTVPSESTGTPVEKEATDLTTAYFASALLNRKQARDEALEVLKTVAASEDAIDATKNDALNEISRIALDIEKEAGIETLIKAKGFEECIAVLNGDSVSVIVKQSDTLLPNQISQIKEIVYTETGILPTAVKIIQK